MEDTDAAQELHPHAAAGRRRVASFVSAGECSLCNLCNRRFLVHVKENGA